MTTTAREEVRRSGDGPDRLPDVAERVSRAVLLVALVVGLAAPGLLTDLGPVLLVTAGLLGLPHGAVDHLAWGWARGEVGRPRFAVVAGYAAAALAAVGVALLLPVPALLVLIALSAAHFAEGEAAWSQQHPGRGVVGPLPGVAAGVAVVALPLLARPDAVRPPLASLDPALPALLLQPGVRIPVLVGTAALVVTGVWAARRSPVRLAELLLVVAVAAVLPPLAAFAVWFAGWHAVRHTARLLLLDPSSADDLRGGLIGPPLARFARAAAPPCLAAVLGTTALALVVGVQGGLLVALLALTVPHTAVVARLRARRAPVPAAP
jgi:Brp/Blh family beta-carotene 15,15'-monooxygenase